MTDPSTLLLLTCATCTPSPAQSALADTSSCSHTQEPDQNLASATKSPCISPPEAIPIALKPDRTAPQIVAQAPRPTPPESLANLSVPDNRVSPMLQFGSQGKAVTDLQMKLQQLGYYKGKIDGIYGRQTEAAVTQLQQAKKLKVDGIAGPQTWGTLRTLSTESEAPAPATESEAPAPATAPEAPAPATAPETPAPATESEAPEPATNSVEQNETSEPESLAPAPPPEVATDPADPERADVRTSVTFTGVPSKYLFLGWGIMFASGFMFILNDGFGRLGRRRLIKRDEPVVPPNEAINGADSADDLAPTLPINSQESDGESAEGEALDSENSEDDPRALLQQIRELIDSAVEVDKTENSSPSSYFIPFNSAKASPQKDGLPPFSGSSDRSSRVRALLMDEKGNLYLSDPDGEASPESLSLDLTDREVIPMRANKGSVQPLNKLVVDLRTPLKFPMFGPQAMRFPTLPIRGSQPLSPPETAEVERQTSPSPSDTPEIAEAETPTVPSAADTFVATLPLGNPRIGEAYSYTLVNDARGRFLLKGNELRMVKGARLEDKLDTNHTIVLRRTDAEGRSEEKSFTIDRRALKVAAIKLRQGFTPVQRVSSAT